MSTSLNSLASSYSMDSSSSSLYMGREMKEGNSYEILTEEDIKTHYNKDTKEAFPIHYEIANGTLTDVNDRVQKVAKANINHLLQKDKTPFGFTPLMLCAIKDDLPTAEAIVKRLDVDTLRSNLKLTDTHGFTAVHFAVPHSKIFELFKSKGADLNMTTLNTHATPQDLTDLITPPSRDLKTISGTSVFVQDANTLMSIEEAISKGQLEQSTKLKSYRDVSYVPPEDWKTLWTWPKYEGQDLECEPAVKEMIDQYLKEGHKVKMVVRKHPSIPNLGVGLFTHKDGIKYKQVLGFYTGQINQKINQSSNYIMGTCIDGENVGNHTSRINCGFPNFLSFETCVKGVDYYVLVVTDSEGIPPDNEILANWGLPYAGKLCFEAPFALLGEESMLKFFKTTKIKRMHQQIKDLEKKVYEKQSITFDDNYLKYRDFCNKFLYPLDHPTALVKLHYLGIVKSKYWIRFIRDQSPAEAMVKWNEQTKNSRGRHMLMLLLDFILDLEKAIKKDLKPLVSEWVIKNLDQCGLIKLTKALELVKKSASELTVENWSTFVASQLTPFMQNPYDWQADIANNPVTKSRRPVAPEKPSKPTEPNPSSATNKDKKRPHEDDDDPATDDIKHVINTMDLN